MHLTSETILRPLWTTSHELPDVDRVALFDQRKSELVVLNALGGEVWRRLDGERSVRQIVVEVREIAESPPALDEAEAQVVRFLEEMLRREAIAPVSD